MNGPCGMYKMKPIHDYRQEVQLPTCMYKVNSIHSASPIRTQEETQLPNVKALEEKQERILQQLQELKTQLQQIRSQACVGMTVSEVLCPQVHQPTTFSCNFSEDTQDIVVSADPCHPPWSLLVLYNLFKGELPIGTNCHVHSSIQSVPSKLSNFFGGTSKQARSNNCLVLTLIWKDVGVDPVMMVNPTDQVAIRGEVNIIRFLAELLGFVNPCSDAVHLTEVDTFLDLAHGTVIHGNNKERQAVLRQLNSRLGKSEWLAGSAMSLADIAMYSALFQAQLIDGAPANIKKWLTNCSRHPAFSELTGME